MTTRRAFLGILMFFVLFSVTPANGAPMDTPLGIYGIWHPHQWTVAYDSTLGPNALPHDETHFNLSREFQKLNSTNATLMYRGVAQEKFHLDYYGNTHPDLTVAQSIAIGAEQGSSSDLGDAYNASTIHGKWTRKTFTAMLRHYGEFDSTSGISWNTLKSEATAYIDDIVDHMALNHLHNPGMVLYYLLDEGVAQAELSGHQRAIFELWEHAVDRIRRVDQTRPIAFSHNAKHLYYQNDDQYHRNLWLSIMKGDTLSGWNIFMEDHYPYYNTEYGWTQAETYDGPIYHYVNYFRDTMVPQRELSFHVREYGEDVGSYEGPKPEWWKYLWAGRSHDYDGQEDILVRRRSTPKEYRVQGYAALANGAKGITMYKYNSSKPEVSSEDELDDTINEHPMWEYLTDSGTDGIVSGDWNSFDDQNGSITLRKNYRRPFSSIADYDLKDDAHSDELWYQSWFYPYDDLRIAYATLETLLPHIRPLRWRWSGTAISNSFTHFDRNENGTPTTRTELALSDAILATTIDGFETNLDDEFHLRDVDGGLRGTLDDIYLQDGTLHYSDLAVGLFEEREGDTDKEYYLLVNTRANQGSSPNFEESSGSEIYTLSFGSLSGNYILSKVWTRDDNDSGTDQLTSIEVNGNPVTSKTINSGSNTATVRVGRGEAILLKLEKPMTSQSGMSYVGGGYTLLPSPLRITSDINVASGHKLILSGQYEIAGNIYVETGSELEIRAGSRILFDNTSTTVEAIRVEDDNSILDIQGTEANPVTLGAKNPNSSPSSWQWGGIRIYDGMYKTVTLNHTIVKDAYAGLYLYNYTDQARTFQNFKAENCFYGVYTRSPGVVMVYADIQGCYQGFYAGSHYNYTGSESVFFIASEFRNLHRGGYSSSMYQFGLLGCTMENVATYGLKTYAVDNLRLENSTYSGKNYFRMIGTDANMTADAALKIRGNTTATTFKENEIVDNGCIGLWLDGSTISSSAGQNNVIANNAMQYDSNGGYSDLYNTQIGLWGYDGTNFNFSDKSVDLYRVDDTWSTKIISNFDAQPDPTDLQVNNVFWGTSVSSVSGIYGQVSPYTWGTQVIPTSIQWTTTANEGDYWGSRQSSSFDPLASSLADAYELLENEETYPEAESLFRELMVQAYSPAISGFSASLRLQGKSVEYIQQELQAVSAFFTSPTSLNRIEFAIQQEPSRHGNHSLSIEGFEEMAQDADTWSDSLLALINGLEVEQLQYQDMLDRIDAGEVGKAAASSDELYRSIETIDARKGELFRQIASRHSEEDDSETMIPEQFELGAAYPNPFNATISVPFDLPEVAQTKLVVYNVLGKRVKTLMNEQLSPGQHVVKWQGQSDSGARVGSGVYFIAMHAGDFRAVRKIVMLK